ncbi:transmembrane protein, putative (macronuclear) [Tetrahymena thermophila SB210]|uniref:Transmembrane protein, putative n=1 Tax=Tetrahymena thermophila (strain SB210) TaxID=312017 RepID=Q23YB1_TETTS|nr:transmembrane protein, putative [Tetrahymena thermophila SB210]EAS01553.2 transmembrane protein, putative [Tetrahymena thermophila SB210]|eukprot:XP_001021798.2 transmembrane protein, putative [Tetrahymena thermophila SB210]
MQSSGDLVDIMIYSSIEIITSECQFIEQQNCYQFDTLQIDNWENMFVPQIISFCLGQVWIFSAATLIILFKAKHVQTTQQVNQEIKNNLQSQTYKGQMVFVQPVNLQALPQQNQNPHNQNIQQVCIPPNHSVQLPQYVEQNQVCTLGQPVNS